MIQRQFTGCTNAASLPEPGYGDVSNKAQHAAFADLNYFNLNDANKRSFIDISEIIGGSNQPENKQVEAENNEGDE